MCEKPLVIGIDTSNYTTSLSLVDVNRKLVKEVRQVLPVPLGKLGLRQSDALFHHVQNLPMLFQQLLSGIDPNHLAAVSSATKPRPLEDSYMPVFLAAKSYGSSLSTAVKIPFYEYSHQEGHIAAGCWSIQWQTEKPFVALHLSGGTTEVLKVTPHKQGYEIDIIGGSSDLSAGQFVDRIGVKIGLSFPAGKELEQMALAATGEAFHIPLSLNKNTISFSGPETFLNRMITPDTDSGLVAKSLFINLGQGLSRLIRNTVGSHDQVLLVGGVASNQLIKQVIQNEFENTQIAIHFADPHYCSDNGVGIGLLGVQAYAT